MQENPVIKKKSKRGLIIVAVIAVILIAALLYYLLVLRQGRDSVEIYVTSVAEITGSGFLSTSNRFAGVVESEETQDVKIEQGREVDEVFVEVGDYVEFGDKLFSYTTADIERRMRQTNIEIEGMYNSINSSRAEIAVLEAEKTTAPAENQIDYTLQIQSLLAGISQTEYGIKTKQVEYEQLQKSFDNSVVTASLAGIIQSINDPDEYDPYTGSALPFMMILKGGDLVVRGTVSEMNVFSLMPGMRVILRSRIDETQMWAGSITKIDTDRTQDDDMSRYYYGPSGGDRASRYSFYVELDSTLGLIIGQHITIELDLGQNSSSGDGIWLFSYYINELEGNAYVWADNGKGRIEKRRVLLGGYNEDLDAYEITSGLAPEDFIAFPDPGISPGSPTTKEFVMPAMEFPDKESYEYDISKDDGGESFVAVDKGGIKF